MEKIKNIEIIANLILDNRFDELKNLSMKDNESIVINYKTGTNVYTSVMQLIENQEEIKKIISENKIKGYDIEEDDNFTTLSFDYDLSLDEARKAFINDDKIIEESTRYSDKKFKKRIVPKKGSTEEFLSEKDIERSHKTIKQIEIDDFNSLGLDYEMIKNFVNLKNDIIVESLILEVSKNKNEINKIFLECLKNIKSIDQIIDSDLIKEYVKHAMLISIIKYAFDKKVYVSIDSMFAYYHDGGIDYVLESIEGFIRKIGSGSGYILSNGSEFEWLGIFSSFPFVPIKRKDEVITKESQKRDIIKNLNREINSIGIDRDTIKFVTYSNFITDDLTQYPINEGFYRDRITNEMGVYLPYGNQLQNTDIHLDNYKKYIHQLEYISFKTQRDNEYKYIQKQKENGDTIWYLEHDAYHEIKSDEILNCIESFLYEEPNTITYIKIKEGEDLTVVMHIRLVTKFNIFNNILGLYESIPEKLRLSSFQ